MKTMGTLKSMAKRSAGGLTLIEMMIVVAILGILVAIAYPAYQEQMRKGRRADAQAVLMQAVQVLERFYSENQRYDQDIAGTAFALPAPLQQAPRDGATKFYDLSLQALAAQTYTLRAVPRGAQTGDRCGTMTITHTGLQAAAKDDCWRR
jgi:type IV pilus assembly protein PilE